MKTTRVCVAVLVSLSACGQPADRASANDTAPGTAQQPDSAAAETPALNVVEYFERMVGAGDLVGGYRFVNSPDGWRCFEPGDDTVDARRYPSVVDIANGFLSIEDDGTGGATYLLQVALFRKADGQVIIARNGRRKEAGAYHVDVLGPAPTFYSYDGATFTDITKDVMPDTATADLFASAPGKADSVGWFYDLPQRGTDIRVSLNSGFADYCKKPERGEMEPELLESINRRCRSYDAVARTSVALTFDKQAGRFKLPR